MPASIRCEDERGLMSIASDEQPEPAPERRPFRFRRRTTFLALAAVAVFCGLVAWQGVIVIVLMVLIAANAAGTLFGLWFCPQIGLDSVLEDLRWDVAKCVVLATIVILVAYGLIRLSPVHYVLLPVPIVILVLAKSFWLDLQRGEIILVGFSSLVATCWAALVLSSLLT